MTRNKVIPLADQITPFIEKLRKIQEQARALGIFPNDRELLVCPRCGLSENVLADGRLITFREPNYNDDTGLRFIEPQPEGGPFICPECGDEAREEEIGIEPVARLPAGRRRELHQRVEGALGHGLQDPAPAPRRDAAPRS